MQTLDPHSEPSPVLKLFRAPLSRRAVLGLILSSGLGFAASGCRQSVAEDASDSDANGYLCLECDAKLYTDRDVFIGPKCPKCQKDSLVEVVGYVCEKDQRLTIRPRAGDRAGAPVCDQCKAPVSAMRLPREKDLLAWGAAKN